MDPFRTVHYEVSEGGEPGGPAAAAEAADPGAEPAAEAEAWTPPTREEVELMNERLERLVDYIRGRVPADRPWTEREPWTLWTARRSRGGLLHHSLGLN